MPFFKTMQEKMDRVNTVMRENLLGVRVIKAFVTAEKEKKRFFESNDDLMNWSIKAQKITILMWPFFKPSKISFLFLALVEPVKRAILISVKSFNNSHKVL